jgi:CheY-like chemotaxis protein
MNRLLIVDDDPKDMWYAYDVARSVGFVDIEGKASCEQTVQFLEAAHLGKCLMPDVIIVDLLLGKESGYEVLRYCNSKPDLARHSGCRLDHAGRRSA